MEACAQCGRGSAGQATRCRPLAGELFRAVLEMAEAWPAGCELSWCCRRGRSSPRFSALSGPALVMMAASAGPNPNREGVDPLLALEHVGAWDRCAGGDRHLLDEIHVAVEYRLSAEIVDLPRVVRRFMHGLSLGCDHCGIERCCLPPGRVLRRSGIRCIQDCGTTVLARGLHSGR